MQIINEYFDGNVVSNDNDNHVGKHHEIHIMNKTFSKLLGRDNIQVNSFHHNTIDQRNLGRNLTSFAVSKHDNTVEGLIHNELPIIGVMWHPERNPDQNSHILLKKIFS